MEPITRKVILSMQMTLDGYIAGPSGEMDWLIAGDAEWEEMFRDLEHTDTFLVGRKMYPGYADYWRAVLADPKSDPNMLKYAKIAEQRQHILFSRTLKSADWHNTKVADDLAREIGRLKQQPGKNIIMWGGAGLAAEAINAGLIDEYRITLNPTVLGNGTALFKNIKERKRLALMDIKPLPSGNVILKYRTA